MRFGRVPSAGHGSLVDPGGTQTASLGHSGLSIRRQTLVDIRQSVQQNSELTSSTSTMWRIRLNCLKPI